MIVTGHDNAASESQPPAAGSPCFRAWLWGSQKLVRGSHDVSVGCAGAERGGAGGRASRSVSHPLRCHQTQNGDSPAPPGWLYQQPLKPGSRQLEPVSTRGACSQQTRGPPLPLKTGSLCLSLPGERSTLSPATGPPRLSLKAASVGVGCPE